MALKHHLFWSFIRNLGIRLGSVIVFIVLARILPPEQLGWFAAALVIINFSEIFSDAGLSDAIAQRKNLTSGLLNTALILNTSIAFAAFLILFSFSESIAKLINAKEASDILLVMSFALLINALGYSAQSYYRHELEFKWLAIRSLISMLAGAVVGISMAFNGFGIWSFVAQFLITSIVNTVLVWLKTPWKPEIKFVKDEAGRLISFGKHILLVKVLDFIANRSLELFIIAVFGPIKLAIYVMGSRIYAVAMQLISAVTVDVMLPSFSKKQTNLIALKKDYKKSFETTLFIISPLFIILSLCSYYLISLLFGANGDGAGKILSLLSILGSVQVVSYLNSSVLNAINKPQLPMFINIIKAISTISLMLLLTITKMEFYDFLLAFVILSSFTSLIGFYFVLKNLRVGIKYYLSNFFLYSIGLFVMLSIVALLPELDVQDFINVIYIGSISFFGYTLTILLIKPKIFFQLKSVRTSQ